MRIDWEMRERTHAQKQDPAAHNGADARTPKLVAYAQVGEEMVSAQAGLAPV